MGTVRQRVLVVDDSEDVREFFQVALELAGYQVETAEDGKDALAKVQHERPDLILLDVVMPVMDGLELLLKLRSDLAPPVPPAILVSGFDITEAEALRRGAVRFLPKPIHAKDLIAAVRDVLAGCRAAAETVASARARASAARLAARSSATKLMSQLEAQTPPGQPFSQHAAQLVAFVARYLAVDEVVAAVLQQDRLEVLASSNPSVIPPGLDLGAALPAVDRVLESGSSLVLPDVASHPSFAWLANRLDELRCLIAVPVRFEKQPIGVLCTLHSCACGIAGEDLALMHHFSSRGTALLEAWVAGRLLEELPFSIGPGIAPRRTFQETLELELRLLQIGSGRSFELAIVGGANLDSVYHALTQAADPSRLMAGILGNERIGIYKRDAGDEARSKLAAILADLRNGGGAVHAGIVDLTGGTLSTLHAEDLLHMAEQALDDATQSSSPVRRLAIESATS